MCAYFAWIEPGCGNIGGNLAVALWMNYMKAVFEIEVEAFSVNKAAGDNLVKRISYLL